MMTAKNSITPQGLARLKDEYRKLKVHERPELTKTIAWAAGNGDRSENGDYIYGKKRLREVDRRLEFLARQIDNAEVIDPETLHHSTIQFGATVLVRNENEENKQFVLVGVQEIDAGRGHISIQSPVAQALLGKEAGDIVTVKTPGGEQELEVIEVKYQALA